MKDFVYSMAPKLFLPVCHKKLKGASAYKPIKPLKHEWLYADALFF